MNGWVENLSKSFVDSSIKGSRLFGQNRKTQIWENCFLIWENVFLIKNKTSNAFVIEDSIYFTTGLLEVINDEDTLKAIYLHEYGHIIKNHIQSKKIEIQQSKNKVNFYMIFGEKK